MTKNSDLNFWEMTSHFIQFTRKKTALFILMFVMVIGVFLALFFTTKPFFNYQMILNSNYIENADLELIFNRLSEAIKNRDQSQNVYFQDKDAVQKIKDLNVIKYYGSEHTNTTISVNIFDTSNVEMIEDGIINYLSQTTEIKSIERRKNNVSDEILKIYQKAGTDSDLKLEELTEDLLEIIRENKNLKSFFVLQSFETNNGVKAGPFINKYIEWGLITFIGIWFLIYWFQLYRPK